MPVHKLVPRFGERGTHCFMLSTKLRVVFTHQLFNHTWRTDHQLGLKRHLSRQPTHDLDKSDTPSVGGIKSMTISVPPLVRNSVSKISLPAIGGDLRALGVDFGEALMRPR